MSDNLRNIEDLFRETFENAKVTPNEETWNNIENNLRSESYFKNKFSGYFVQPSNSVWVNIQRRLILINFFRFNLTSFNFYYLSSFIVMLILAFNLFDGNAEGLRIESIAQNSELQFKEPNNNNYENDKLINQFDNNEIVNTYISEVRVVDNNIDINEAEIPNDKLINEEKSIIVNTEIADQEYSNEIVINENTVDEIENSNFNANEIVEYNLTNEELATTESINNNNLNESINLDNELINISLIENPKINLLELKNYSSIPNNSLGNIFEINYIDTLAYDAFGSPILWDKTKWSVELVYSPFISMSDINILNSENKLYEETLNKAISPALSNLYGFNLNFAYKNILIQGGIHYNQFKENFKYNELFKQVDTTINYETYYTYEESITTYWVLDLDTYLTTGETVLIEVIDTSIIKVPNQKLVTSYDSLIVNKPIRNKNKYSYIDFPITFGYQFKQNKFVFTPKIGLITGLYINSSGNYINSSYIVNDVNSDKLPYIKIHFSSLASIGIEYKLNDFFSIIADPYIRTSLNSIYQKNSNTSYKFNAYGLRLGLRYNF